MKHTPKIKKAIQFAARKHHGQFRKEHEELPYISHPFSVALLIAETGGDEDVITAALLHDTLEDTKTTIDEIVELFGLRVAELVVQVSEPEKDETGKKLSWRERKEKYIAQHKTSHLEALLISIADKIDNTEGKIETLEVYGPTFLKNFVRPQEEYLWFHGELVRVAKERLPNHPLTKRLSEAHKKERDMLGGL